MNGLSDYFDEALQRQHPGCDWGDVYGCDFLGRPNWPGQGRNFSSAYVSRSYRYAEPSVSIEDMLEFLQTFGPVDRHILYEHFGLSWSAGWEKIKPAVRDGRVVWEGRNLRYVQQKTEKRIW